MSRSIHTLLFAAAVASATAFAQPTPPAPPAPPAPPVAARAEKKISVQFQGRLGDALKKIAEKGGINLIITGKLDEPAEVYLTNVSAEEALALVAESHHLVVARKGSIWTARPMSGPESAEHRAELSEAQQEADEAAREAQEEAREAAEEAREAAEEARVEAMEAAREAAEEAAAESGVPQDLQQRIEQRIERRMHDRSRRLENKMRRLAQGRDQAGYGTIVVAEGETVDDAVSYGGSLEVYGHVEGDAVAFGGPVKLGPKAYVEGDVVAFGGPIEKAKGAVVEGDEITMTGAEAGLSLARGVRMRRHLDSGPSGEDSSPRVNDRPIDFSLPGFLLWFSALFAVGFITSMAAPNQMKKMETEIVKNPLRTGVIGAISVIALPVLSVLLFVTVVGAIPVVLFWLLLVPVGMAAGASAIAHEIGLRLPLRNVRKTQAIVLALGLLILVGIFHIPYLGVLAMILVGLLSLGAISRMMIDALNRRRQGVPTPL